MIITFVLKQSLKEEEERMKITVMLILILIKKKLSPQSM